MSTNSNQTNISSSSSSENQQAGQLTVNEPNISVGPARPQSSQRQQLNRLTSSFKGELDHLKLQLRPGNESTITTRPSIGNRTSGANNSGLSVGSTLVENLISNEDQEDEHEEQTRLIPRGALCSCRDSQPLVLSQQVASSSTATPSFQSNRPCLSCARCIHCNCICKHPLGRENKDNNSSNSNNNDDDKNKMATKGQTAKLIPAYFVAELIGTFLLVVSSSGYCYSTLGTCLVSGPECWTDDIGRKKKRTQTNGEPNIPKTQTGRSSVTE